LNAQSEPSWYDETFGHCPHGHIKPYCAQCVGDELYAKREERQRKREERDLGERKELQQTVDRQSAALDQQATRIKELERLLFEARRKEKKRRLFGRP